MIIGIDIDNTIIDYKNAFLSNLDKLDISSSKLNKLKKLDNLDTKYKLKKKIHDIIGEKNWQKLQGLTYGKGINSASIFNEFINFLLVSKNRNIQIYFISHKTMFAHGDKNKTIKLRDEVLKFLKKKYIINRYTSIKKQNIFFFSSKEEKISCIKKLKCDYFIDDLKEILIDKNFPNQTKKILFNNSTKNKYIESHYSWRTIRKSIFGNYTKSDIKLISNFILRKDIQSIQRVKSSGRNSKIFKVIINKSKLCLKFYPDIVFDKRKRLQIEQSHLNLLKKNKINYIPKVLYSNRNLNCIAFNWIEKNKIYISKKDVLNKYVNFIKILKNKSQKINKFAYNASDCCFNGIDIIDQLRTRFIKISKINNQNRTVLFFLKKNILNTINIEIKKSKANFSQYFNKNYKIKNAIFSPSDFGFHNIINSHNGINFIDFEYSGLDDPAKLLCDFIIRPNNKLTIYLKKYWFKKTLNLFEDDKSIKIRLINVINLYALCWVLIILNDTNKDLKKNQLDKILTESKTILDNISKNYYKAILYECI